MSRHHGSSSWRGRCRLWQQRLGARAGPARTSGFAPAIRRGSSGASRRMPEDFQRTELRTTTGALARMPQCPVRSPGHPLFANGRRFHGDTERVARREPASNRADRGDTESPAVPRAPGTRGCNPSRRGPTFPVPTTTNDYPGALSRNARDSQGVDRLPQRSESQPPPGLFAGSRPLSEARPTRSGPALGAEACSLKPLWMYPAL